jgi:hypothetical protein
MDSSTQVTLSKESQRPTPRLEIPQSSPSDSVITLVSQQPKSVFESESKSEAMSKPKGSTAVLAIESIILVLAATTLGLASAYGNQILHAPRAVDLIPHFKLPSQVSPRVDKISLAPRLAIGTGHLGTPQQTAESSIESWVVFYSGTMPVLSIFMAGVGILLSLRKKITPLYSTIISAVFLCGWCVNLGWWIACDWSTTLAGSGKAPKSKLCKAILRDQQALIILPSLLPNPADPQ